MSKRLTDLTLAALLLVVLSPLLLVVALLVRLESPGPVIFGQRRLGRDGRPFRIHKFRTHRQTAIGPPVTPDGDARVTRIGTVLRRFKLDELPQLLDVAAGRMSLVGPRPELPENLASVSAPDRARLLTARPGLTGPAALAFIAEDAALRATPDPVRVYRELIVPRKVAIELDYQDRATPGSDLVLLARTFWQVLSPAARRRSRRMVEALIEQSRGRAATKPLS